MDLIEQVQESIDKYDLLSRADKVIVSVSGGPDSLTLLHILWRLRFDYDLKLHIFHLDHMFRGQESAADADYVAEVAAELELPVTIEEYDLPEYIQQTGLSKQAAARKIRYQLCSKLALQIGADKIAIGQQADDQAETVLINFLRGAGLRGLSGISPIRNNKFIRPLLEVWRSDIEKYCSRHELNPRLDSSNLKKFYLRNKIRWDLLPYLAEEFNSSIKDSLNRMASLLRAEDNFLAEYADNKYQEILIVNDADQIELDLEALQLLDLAILRRIIRQAIADFCGTKKDYYFQHIQQVIKLIKEGDTAKRLELPNGLRILRGYKSLKLKWQEDIDEEVPEFKTLISIPGEYELEELGVKIKLESKLTSFKLEELIKDSAALFLDQDLIGEQIIVRNRRAGDCFSPLGMRGTKKIKDFFIDQKIVQKNRDQIPIFTTFPEKDIFAVGDLRIDNNFKITEKTAQVLILKVEQL